MQKPYIKSAASYYLIQYSVTLVFVSCFVVMVSPQIFLQMYVILYLHLQKKEGMIDFIYGNVYIKKSPVPALVYNRDTVFFMPYLWKRKAVITFT